MMIAKINKYLYFPFYTVDNKITCRCCNNDNGCPKVVRRQRKSLKRLNKNEHANRK